MTTIKNNTVTITAPCTGTVGYDNGTMYISDLDGLMRYIPTNYWDTILVNDGTIVNYGDVLGQSQLDTDGDIDEGVALTEHAVDVCASELAEQFMLPIVHVTNTDCYTIKVGDFTVNSEYGEHCRVTTTYGDSQLISSIAELISGLEYYANNGRFLVF